jgi:hypothetical protein
MTSSVIASSSSPYPARVPHSKRDGRRRRRNIREAIELYLETLVEDGLPTPMTVS